MLITKTGTQQIVPIFSFGEKFDSTLIQNSRYHVIFISVQCFLQLIATGTGTHIIENIYRPTEILLQSKSFGFHQIDLGQAVNDPVLIIFQVVSDSPLHIRTIVFPHRRIIISCRSSGIRTSGSAYIGRSKRSKSHVADSTGIEITSVCRRYYVLCTTEPVHKRVRL